MIQCTACRIWYVDNTLFCAECGTYLPLGSDRTTGAIEPERAPYHAVPILWTAEGDPAFSQAGDKPDSGPQSIRLRVSAPAREDERRRTSAPPSPIPFPSQGSGQARASVRPAPARAAAGRRGAIGRLLTAAGHHPPAVRSQAQELEISLARPVRLGRVDPAHDIFPEVDLTGFRGVEHGVSREHARIFRKGDRVKVEDLASTNGTLLNGQRLAPYLATPLQDGDRLQLGKLLIEVGIAARGSG